MTTPLESLVACGTRLWLDSVDPELMRLNRQWGATGATSNPVIVADLIKTGRFDDRIARLLAEGLDDEAIAWRLTDGLVRESQEVLAPVWRASGGDDGYVSFELDPLLEKPGAGPPHDERVARYVELARHWSSGHENRMIKVPATPAGLAALPEMVASGVTVNVTLIFTPRQYRAAREAVWRGAQRRGRLDQFKSVYSIFISRIDVYTEARVPGLSEAAQGEVGIVIAKRIWRDNQAFWQQKELPLAQEIVFASTGTKKPGDAPWKYVVALAGSDIQTNPPATNDAVRKSDLEFARQVDKMPPADVLAEIDEKVDLDRLERVLMEEGVKKFTDPQEALLKLIAEHRARRS
ncbi:MAG: transaldolase [Pirellulales bacterium]|nr:transaldolase [Pirellulales bacterium]